MASEEKNKVYDTTLKFMEDRFIPPEVDQLYFLRGTRYRCLEVSQRVDDKNGDITIETVFRREYTRFEELYSDEPKEVLD